MIRRPPRSTLSSSSAASDVYKRQVFGVWLFHGLGLYQFVEMGAQTRLRINSNFVLNRLARGVNLLGCVLRNDFTRLAADFGTHDRLQVLRTDKFVEHGDGVMQQLKPDTDLSDYAHAVLGNSVVCLRRGMQSQVIKEQLVPRPDNVETFISQLLGI